MKLWIDECLSPTLAKRANERGLWATCNRDRGLVVLSQGSGREAQWLLLDNVIDYIDACAKAADEAPADWMVNRYVEVDLHRSVVHGDLP